MRSGMTILAIVVLIFSVIGFGMLGYAIRSMLKSTQAAYWPKAVGVIDHCELVTDASPEGTTYYVKVNYSYNIAGTNYHGDTIAFGYAGSSFEATQKAVFEKLKNAKFVEVRYDEADPKTSVLSHGIHRSSQTLMLFSIIWLAILIGLTVLLWTITRSDTVLLNNLVTQ